MCKNDSCCQLGPAVGFCRNTYEFTCYVKREFFRAAKLLSKDGLFSTLSASYKCCLLRKYKRGVNIRAEMLAWFCVKFIEHQVISGQRIYSQNTCRQGHSLPRHGDACSDDVQHFKEVIIFTQRKCKTSVFPHWFRSQGNSHIH